jgi:hypothetical protein
MLLGLDPVLSPDLLHALASHGARPAASRERYAFPAAAETACGTPGSAPC